MHNDHRAKAPGLRVGKSFRIITNALFDCKIDKIADNYTKIANRLLATNGPKWTCQRLKDYYNFACSIALHTEVINIPFCKTKGGFPVDLLAMKPYLTSPRIEKRRACLTLLRSYTQIYSEASEDVSSIVEPGPDISLLSDYRLQLEKITRKYKAFLKPRLRDESLFTSSKNGPNGPALLNVDKDYVAIKESGILETIRQLNKEISDTCSAPIGREVNLSNGFAPDFDSLADEMDDLACKSRFDRKEALYECMENFTTWRKQIESDAYERVEASRLGFISEGGCKTRVIAIADYFTQDCLKPIHRDLYRLLNRLETDGTSSHNRISQVVKKKTSEGSVVWSFDLTSATDRFPIFLQELVLSEMYGPKVSKLWSNLMINRKFKSPGGYVKYEVGQPMGLLSSWPAFALTHHIVVEACALKIGKTSFKDYCLIGDDLTIFDESVAKEYLRFLNTFNIKISEAKSLVSKGKPHSSAEIAKRLFLDGKEISPIPYDAIESAIKNYLLFPNLIRLSMERDVISNSYQQKPVQDLFKAIYPKGNKAENLTTLLTCPLSRLPFGITENKWDVFEEVTILNEFNRIKIDHIRRKAEDLYRNELANIPDMGILGLALESESGPSKLERHPLMTVLRAYRDRCGSIYQGILIKGIDIKDLELITFLVNPMIPQYMRRTHQIEKVRSTLILKTYKCLIELQLESVTGDTAQKPEAKPSVADPWGGGKPPWLRF